MGIFDSIRKVREKIDDLKERRMQRQGEQYMKENAMLQYKAENAELKARVAKAQRSGGGNAWAQKGANLAAFINGTPVTQPRAAPRRPNRATARHRRSYMPRPQRQSNPFDALNNIKL